MKDYIINLVSEAYGVSIEQMKHKTRKRYIVHARHVAMWLLAYNSELSLPAIGRIFGDRDHSTVIHARDKINDICEMYVYEKRAIKDLNKKVRSQKAA